MVILYSPRCLDYAAAGHPESPERIRPTVAQLQKEFHAWELPTPCSDEDILRVHTRELLEAARTGAFEDADTPFFPEILEIAKLSAGAAMLAAEHALAGRPAFSLMRPPGHHAERDRIMGFCYLNNIAIAVARTFHSSPRIQRVAILDFDCHHGNGTENVFRGDDRVLFVSLHQSPCYPGTGLASKANCVNYPLPPGTGPEKFLAALDNALVLIRNFQPQLLAVSAGFDAYRDDPITHMNLDVEAFHQIGLRLAHLTKPSSPAASALPCFAVLEGGYSRQFPHCVDAFLAGWEQH
jgi:acetoin utilization deacetylase AcuC-like enzyme